MWNTCLVTLRGKKRKERKEISLNKQLDTCFENLTKKQNICLPFLIAIMSDTHCSALLLLASCSAYGSQSACVPIILVIKQASLMYAAVWTPVQLSSVENNYCSNGAIVQNICFIIFSDCITLVMVDPESRTKSKYTLYIKISVWYHFLWRIHSHKCICNPACHFYTHSIHVFSALQKVSFQNPFHLLRTSF